MTVTLRERVAACVQAVYPEGANAAAAAIGIPQPTLFKILAGRSENPRASTLQAIATHFDTSVEWLLSGRGTPPVFADEGGDSPQTCATLARIGVSSRGQAWWQNFVSELGRAVDEPLRSQLTIGEGHTTPAKAIALYAKRRARALAADRMLAASIELLIEQAGPTAARKHLESDAVLTAMMRRLLPPE